MDISNLHSNPFHQFKVWFEETVKETISEANAIVLSTVGADGKPTSRLLLLKDFNENGFTFFTNYKSKKSQQLDVNFYGCLLFPWHDIQRQVRIEGVIYKISEEESDSYFSERPKGSQIGAWVSAQSSEIASRNVLDELEKKYRIQFTGKTIPRPANWGGYRLVPDLFEFWQGRENRLHDWFEYCKNQTGWQIRRLAP